MASGYRINGVDLDDICELRTNGTPLWNPPSKDFNDGFLSNGVSMKGRYAKGYEAGMDQWFSYMKTIELTGYMANGVTPVVAKKGYRPYIADNIANANSQGRIFWSSSTPGVYYVTRPNDTEIKVRNGQNQELVSIPFSYAPHMVLFFICGGGGGGGNGGGTTSAGGAGGAGVCFGAIRIPSGYSETLTIQIGRQGSISGSKNASGSSGGDTILNLTGPTKSSVRSKGGTGGYADNGGSGAPGGSFVVNFADAEDGCDIQSRNGGAGGNAYNGGGACALGATYTTDGKENGWAFNNTGAGGPCNNRGGGGGGSIGKGGYNSWDGHPGEGPGAGGGGGGYGWFDGHWGGNGYNGAVYLAY